MTPSPEPKPRGRLVRSLVVAVVVVAATAVMLGFGDVVRAAFQDPPLIKPYDPLPRW